MKKYFGFEEAVVKASDIKSGYLVLTVSNELVNKYFLDNRYVCYFCLTETGVFTFIYNSNN